VRSLICPRARGYRVHRSARRPACFHAFRSAVLENRYLSSCGTKPRPFSHLSVSPSEFLRLDRCSRLSVRATTYKGLCPHRDITSARPPFARVPKSSLCSVLRRSQPLDGLLRSKAGGPISSHSRVQGAPVQGFCRSAQPPSLIRRSCPHAVGVRPAHRRIGCHRPNTPTSRRFSMQSRVSRVRRLDLAHDRSPLRVCCSSRCASDHHACFHKRERS